MEVCSCACLGKKECRPINASRQKNQAAEGKKSMWLDIGMQINGRKDKVHVAIFDHPNNAGWRVDDAFGVGPSRLFKEIGILLKGTLLQHRILNKSYEWY